MERKRVKEVVCLCHQSSDRLDASDDMDRVAMTSDSRCNNTSVEKTTSLSSQQCRSLAAILQLVHQIAVRPLHFCSATQLLLLLLILMNTLIGYSSTRK